MRAYYVMPYTEPWNRWAMFVAAESRNQARWSVAKWTSEPGDVDENYLEYGGYRAAACDDLCGDRIAELDWEICARLMGWDVEALKEMW